jgi:hypothetical protein
MPRTKKTAASSDPENSEPSPTTVAKAQEVNVASRYGNVGPTKLTTVDDIAPEGRLLMKF